MMHALSLPIRQEVDLCVVGASTAAVAAAGAAADAGASVLVLCERPYLGEDVTATLRFPRDQEMTTPLGQALFGAVGSGRPTPRHLKATLDDHLLVRKIPFLYGTYGAAPLRDADGRVSGVLVGSRSGFFAVRARLVLDASWSGQFTRACGFPFTKFRGGTLDVERVAISREANTGEDFTTDPEGLPVFWKEGESFDAHRHHYRFRLEAADASLDALMTLELESRRRAWNPGILYAADSAWLLPPEKLDVENPRDAAGADLPLEALATHDPALWILGPCAGLTDGAARELTTLPTFLAVGERLGTHLANLARQTPFRKLSEIYHPEATEFGAGVLRSDSSGLRVQEAARHLELTLDRVPLLDEVDVLVMGGGTAGASAGIAAAREGARTLLCEYQSMLGGVGTAGMITGYWFGNKVGFTSEIDAGVAALGSRELQKPPHWNAEWKSFWYQETYREAGGHLWLGTIGCGALLEGQRVRGVLVATPSGFGLVRCETVIDATGNSDIAAHAGAECEWIDAQHVGVQGVGQGPRIPGKFYGNTDWTFSDDTDIDDATNLLALTRFKFRESFDTQGLINTRERRRIRGDLTLSPLDFLARRTFPDTIVRARSNFDTHGFTVHPLFMAKAPDKKPIEADVPFRCLLPQGVDGILVTGLGKSAHRDASPVIRMQADVQNEGFAAGLAAAMVCREKLAGDFRRLDIRALQRQLVEIGNLSPEVLEQTDSFPLPDEVVSQAVASGTDTYLGLGIIFANADRALPLLEAKWPTIEDDDERQRVAVLLGLLGSRVPAEFLARSIADSEWDAGWKYRGMGQFGASLSELDVRIVALGQSGAREQAGPLLEKIDQLAGHEDEAMSHARALGMAVEALDLEEAAPKLAALLSRPGWAGHEITDSATARRTVTASHVENNDRNLSLREIHLARALFRIGDHGGLGESILRKYADDLRGIYARHAKAVLAERQALPATR